MRVFSGTPDEYKQVAHLFTDAAAPSPIVSAGITADAIYAAFRQTPPGAAQEALIEAVVAAYPGQITKKDLQNRLPAKLGGVLGNVGRILTSGGVPKRSASGKRPSRQVIHYDRKTRSYSTTNELVEAWRRFKAAH